MRRWWKRVKAEKVQGYCHRSAKILQPNVTFRQRLSFIYILVTWNCMIEKYFSYLIFLFFFSHFPFITSCYSIVYFFPEDDDDDADGNLIDLFLIQHSCFRYLDSRNTSSSNTRFNLDSFRVLLMMKHKNIIGGKGRFKRSLETLKPSPSWKKIEKLFIHSCLIRYYID